MQMFEQFYFDCVRKKGKYIKDGGRVKEERLAFSVRLFVTIQ